MNTIHDFCDASYKRLTGLKTDLKNFATKTESAKDDSQVQTIAILQGLLSEIEDEINELKNECPADWSAAKQELDRKLDKLETNLNVNPPPFRAG